MPTRLHVEQIKELSIQEIARLEPWEILALAIPRGERRHIAEFIKVAPRTVASWCNDPETRSEIAEPHGRRGIMHEFMNFLLAIHARCPEGAQLIHRWLECRLAEAEAIQGRDELRAAQRMADAARALAEQIIAITGGPAKDKA